MPTLATGSRFDVKPGTVESYIWRLIRTADKLRSEWADSDAARRQELWRSLHTASDVATAALEEGPAEAERMEQAERAHRDRERRLAAAETAAGLPVVVQPEGAGAGVGVWSHEGVDAAEAAGTMTPMEALLRRGAIDALTAMADAPAKFGQIAGRNS